MNNSTIKNKMVTVPKGIKLNDEDYLNSVLSSFKEMSKNYNIVLTEASNEALYKTLKKQYDAITNMQRSLFELMFEYGWYSLEKAPKTTLDSKYNTLNTQLKDEKTKKGFKFFVCCALMISSMIGMFGCRLENGPYDSPCSEWRSEDPDMSFTVGQESGLTEKIYGSVIIEGQEYCMYILSFFLSTLRTIFSLLYLHCPSRYFPITNCPSSSHNIIVA